MTKSYENERSIVRCDGAATAGPNTGGPAPMCEGGDVARTVKAKGESTTKRGTGGRRILGLDADQRKAERERLVLEAALELFGTQGYPATSIEQICQTAAVGTNSFYGVFTSKEDVMIRLNDDIGRRIADAVVADLAHTTATGPQLLQEMIESYVRHLVTDRRVALVAYIEVAGIGPAVEQHRRDARHKFAEIVETIGYRLEPGYRAGRASGAKAVAASKTRRRNALGILGAVGEIITDWLLDPDPDPVDALIADLTHHCDLVIGAIYAEPGSKRRR